MGGIKLSWRGFLCSHTAGGVMRPSFHMEIISYEIIYLPWQGFSLLSLKKVAVAQENSLLGAQSPSLQPGCL